MSFASESLIRKALIEGRPVLDVRAPVEFQAGSLPGAVNLPILNDEERHQVGTAYKQNGPQAAVTLGEKLVSGAVKDERVHQWKKFFEQNPESLLYCFRGGQRSQYAQTWLHEVGVNVPRIEGGYKKWRQILMGELSSVAAQKSYFILAGRTGSGKTEFLRKAKNQLEQVDLEALANHRGSAFGGHWTRQPSQVDFENRTSLQFQRTKGSVICLEDESRMIGTVFIPDPLFNRMKESPVVLLSETTETRASRIFEEYVRTPIETVGLEWTRTSLRSSLDKIQRKLGGLRTTEAKGLLEGALLVESRILEPERHLPWITYLLENYYDPLYEYGLEKKKDRIQFQGNHQEVLEFLRLHCPTN